MSRKKCLKSWVYSCIRAHIYFLNWQLYCIICISCSIFNNMCTSLSTYLTHISNVHILMYSPGASNHHRSTFPSSQPYFHFIHCRRRWVSFALYFWAQRASISTIPQQEEIRMYTQLPNISFCSSRVRFSYFVPHKNAYFRPPNIV